MGCILNKIDDHYDEYVELCKKLNVTPENITNDFYTHWKELRNKIENNEYRNFHSGSDSEP